MKRLQKMLEEISRLTAEIEANYPELYRTLDENPMTIPSHNDPKISLAVLEEYQNSLRELLRHQSQKNKPDSF